MTRPRVQKELALFIGLAVLNISSSALAEQPCAQLYLPSASDPDHSLAQLLVQRGLSVSQQPELCAKARLEVIDQGPNYRIVLRRGAAQEQVRQVSSLQMAALWIESALWQPEALGFFQAQQLTEPPKPLRWSPKLHLSTSPKEIVRPATIYLQAAAQFSVGSDTSLWVGADLGVCIRWSFWCVGLWAQHQREPAAVAPAEESAWQGREATSLLLGGEWALALRQFTLRPFAAVGIGWTSNRGQVEQEALGATSNNFRGSAGLSLSKPVTPDLAVDLLLRADFSSLTQERHQDQRYSPPPEPEVLVRTGLGLRWGAL